jgi:hypothetical protein
MKTLSFTLLLCLLSILLYGQWSINPLLPNLIAGFENEQVLPKVAITNEGNVYVSRFDNQAGSYQVFLQYFSQSGEALWPLPNGILVSSYPQMTWLTEYDLDVDTQGNAVITFQDVRNSNVNNVMLYKVDPEGNILWNPDGIAITTDTDINFSNMSPVVFCSADNSTYVAWQRTGTTNSIGIQRINTEGSLLWGDGIYLSVDGSSCTWPQIIQSEGNDILLKYFVDSGPFWAPTRHQYVSRLNSEGTTLWNTVITDAGGMPAWQQLIPFVPDGSGGAVLAWYDDRSNDMVNEVYTQRIDAEGIVTMPANGALISTDTANQQYYPKLAVDSANEHIYAFYKVTDSGQTTSGMGRQLMDFDGNRLWGETGIYVVDLGNNSTSPVAAYMTEYGGVCIYERSLQPMNDSEMGLYATSFRANGNSFWPEQILNIATDPINKYHYDFARSAEPWSVIAWESGLSDMDIYAMRLNDTGTLGMYYPAPINLSAEIISDGEILLNWEAGSPQMLPNAYRIYVNDSLEAEIDGNINSYTYNYPTPNTYEFYLTAVYDGQNYSAPSEVVTVICVSNPQELLTPSIPSVQIHPNPIRTTVLISYSNAKLGADANLEVFNLKGQLVFTKAFTPLSFTGEMALSEQDLASLRSGIYFFRIKMGTSFHTRKVMILR